MLSSLIKVKNLYSLKTFFAKSLPLKSECCGWYDCVLSNKLSLGNPLYARGKKSLRIGTVEEGTLEEPDPVHFGKVIGLDPDEVEVDENYSVNFKKKSNKSSVLKDGKPYETSGDSLKISQKKEFKIEKLGKNSVLLCSRVPNLKFRKARERRKEILVEGKRLIHEAISAGCQLLGIYFSRIEDLDTLNIPENVKLYKTPYKQIQLWSDVVTSQGILAIFKMPELPMCSNNIKAMPLTIICDNIRDPGNLGAVLRVAASVGCEKLILTKGCVDLWESKVLRSAAGCHFRMPAIQGLEWSDIRKEVGENSQIILAENASSGCSLETKEKFNSSHVDLPLHNYASLDYCKGHTVIIVGGESHGLSESAYQFAVERKGIKISIPMCNQVESLNIAVALGILSYEVRRQWDLLSKNSKNLLNDSPEVEGFSERWDQILTDGGFATTFGDFWLIRRISEDYKKKEMIPQPP